MTSLRTFTATHGLHFVGTMRLMLASDRPTAPNTTLTTINGINNWDTSQATDMSFMFYCRGGLTSLDLTGWDTHNATKMTRMFNYCTGLTSITLPDTFTTANVTDMCYMFSETKLTTLDLSYFDTKLSREEMDSNQKLLSMLPATLKTLKLGANTKLNEYAFRHFRVYDTWIRVSSMGDNYTALEGLITGSVDGKEAMVNRTRLNPAGIWKRGRGVTVSIDFANGQAGTTTTINTYSIRPGQGTLTMPSMNGRPNPTGKLFDHWELKSIATHTGYDSNQPDDSITFLPDSFDPQAKLTAIWRDTPSPTNLKAAYHYTGDKVTLSGTSPTTNDVSVCLTGVAPCQTVHSDRNLPATPTSGQPSATLFTTSPSDTGKLDITFAQYRISDGQVIVCPVGTAQPTYHNIPVTCTTKSAVGMPTGSQHYTYFTSMSLTGSDFKWGYGDYNIWAVGRDGSNNSFSTVVATNYHYRQHYDIDLGGPFSVDWPANEFSIGGQYQFEVNAGNIGDPVTGNSVPLTTQLRDMLPYTTVDYTADGANGTPPSSTSVFTDDATNKASITLPLLDPTANGGLGKASSVLAGWATTNGATTPTQDMGNPSQRDIELSTSLGTTDSTGHTTLTLHPVWHTISAPAITAFRRDPATNRINVDGTGTPWTQDDGIQICVKPDTPFGAYQCQTATWNDTTPLAWNGTVSHHWTHVFPQSGALEHARNYIAKATLITPDPWRTPTNSTANSPDTISPSTQIGSSYIYALPLTGGSLQRVTSIAIVLGVALLLLALAKRLRVKRAVGNHGGEDK
ncbi:BspA family leucine-rich repeat surface protein [Bifidobacterium sp. ESL0682]|uniref:BspA family leucine-rich repeat surface protein n=1 Tax=Bifidobacterium sp. ESL0682 TaxID=2983212 RepID=UPI0023F8D223|nr:BspA family leucine-rich repeat surface protein [Bifidobacterium sp. ESL0682]WEV41744.1 BspA family leucine-rich repeat surface protein [Bifidobacterium sp. ESL0682]